MASLALKRILSNSSGTYGVLLRDNQPYCVTLEPVNPIILKGIYSVIKYDSPKFKRKVFLIENVPGHEAVEIHIGNTIDDTHGCILLGKSFSNTFKGVSNSAEALANLLDLMPDKFILEVL